MDLSTCVEHMLLLRHEVARWTKVVPRFAQTRRYLRVVGLRANLISIWLLVLLNIKIGGGVYIAKMAQLLHLAG